MPDNPSIPLFQIMTGYWGSQALHVVTRLGIADLLQNGARSVPDLAAEKKVHGPTLYRVLRAVAALGVFAERPDGKFENTPMSELLRSDVRGSLRAMVLMQNADWHWKIYMDMMHAVRTGETVAQRVLGAPVFEWFSKNPEEARTFDESMRGFSESVNPPIIEAYDFSGIRKLIDVGGGYGGLISGILKSRPEMKGAICDLPHVA